jgi:hypothetical protein
MEIEMTLDQLKRFIPKLTVNGGGTKSRSMLKCIPILEQSLVNNVFKKPHNDTVKIETKRELAVLIAKGVNHKPSPARPGAPYNKEYLELKRRLGENYPHKFMDYGFWMGTQVLLDSGDSLKMKAKPALHRGFNYLSHHEERRSVLKRAFLDAWQDIIKTIIDNIADEAKSS